MGGATATCPACGGTGQSQNAAGSFFMIGSCAQCQGTGTVITSRCKRCRGTGEATRTRHITVKVPAGVHTGSKVRVASEGGRGLAGGPPGDLLLSVKAAPHRLFRREGDDIHVDLPVTFVEAAMGAKVDVPTIDGPVTMTIPEGTKGGQTLRLRGKGVQHLGREGRGDEHVHINVVVPDKLTDQQRKLLEEFNETWEENPRKSMAR